MSQVGRALAAGGSLLLLCGCAVRPPLLAWQARVSDYIRGAGCGDANVLVGLPQLRCRGAERPARITIGVDNLPAGLGATRDVQGLLLGYRRLGDAPCYIFIVGVLRIGTPGGGPADPARDIEDVRLVALRPAGEGLVWERGEPDGAALARYRAGRTKARMLDSPADLFPGAGDLFQLRVEGRVITVTERRSGATWRLAGPVP
jgi:hypothetical protein